MPAESAYPPPNPKPQSRPSRPLLGGLRFLAEAVATSALLSLAVTIAYPYPQNGNGGLPDLLAPGALLMLMFVVYLVLFALLATRWRFFTSFAVVGGITAVACLGFALLR